MCYYFDFVVFVVFICLTCMLSQMSVYVRVGHGPLLLTQSNPIHGWIQSMSNFDEQRPTTGNVITVLQYNIWQYFNRISLSLKWCRVTEASHSKTNEKCLFRYLKPLPSSQFHYARRWQSTYRWVDGFGVELQALCWFRTVASSRHVDA